MGQLKLADFDNLPEEDKKVLLKGMKHLKPEGFGKYNIYIAKLKNQYYYLLITNKKDVEIYRDVVEASTKRDLLEKIKRAVSYREPSRDKIVFENMNQVVLFKEELSGQISDGNWENSSPFDHWKQITGADIFSRSQSNPNVGMNFRPRRTYNFNAQDLYDVVSARMLFAVRAYNILGFSPEIKPLNDEMDLFKDYTKYSRDDESRAKKITKGDTVKYRGQRYRVNKVQGTKLILIDTDLYSRYNYSSKDIPDKYFKKINLRSTKKDANMYWSEKLEQMKYELGADTEAEFKKKIVKIMNYNYTEDDLHKDLKAMSKIVNNAYRAGGQL